MSALTSLLVRDEVVSVRQIEDALSRQVLEGGELDTALLELDAAPENVLNAYRAASFRLPAVARDEVMGISAATLSLVSRDQAQHYRVIPITHDATTLLVATYQPLHEIPRNELGAVIGMRVECCIACEVRIEAALASHYGLPMGERMLRLAERVDSSDAGALPSVTPILETPISGLAAELFDGLDDADDVVEVPDGAQPIAYESLRPGPSQEVSVGRVVEVRPSQLPPADAPAPAKSSNAPHATQTGFARSSAPPAQDAAADPVRIGGADRPAVPPRATTAAAAPAPRAPQTEARPPAAEALARASGARVANDVPDTSRAKSRPRRAGAVPQGPLSRELASQLLERADDRDAVVEVFFRYARQYFDATALCSIREDRVLGREVHNVPNLNDIRGLSLSVARGSALEELSRTLQPRIGDLSRKTEDRPLAEALQRLECQPSVLLPVCVQRRVVAIVYGDRGGEFFRQSDLAALIELLPEVSRAFERIIRTRKVLGLSARAQTIAHAAAELGRAATQLDVVAPGGARDSSPDPAKAEAMLRNARRALSALGAPRTAPPPPGAAARMTQSIPTRTDSQLGTATAASAQLAAAPGSAAHAVALPGAAHELDRLPTSRLPAVDALPALDSELDIESPTNPEPVPKPPAYMSKPPPGAGRYSSAREGEGDEPELGVESDTKPLRSRASRTAKRSGQSELSAADPVADATADTVTSLPTPRFESPVPEARVVSPRPSKPPPGTGVYRQQDVSSEVISLPAGRRSPQPAPAPTPAPPKGRRSQPPRATSSIPPRPPTDPGRSSKRPPAPDARREDPAADASPEYVSQANTARYASVAREASVIVDTLGQTRGLIDDLCACGPDDEGPMVQSLLRVGDEAIDLLIERFPGPLWFDRRRPYARLPFGRDTGPIARALAAFGEAALPKMVPLLRAQNADVRYYAVLFASDRVHPELLVPIAERLFDEDPQIRLMVRDTLPSYRSLPAFAQVLGSLRTRMLETRAPVPARLAAIDGVTNLRDGQAVPALVELLAHADRQLSIPAHRALVAITCQDFGTSTKKWRLWYEDNQHRHRVQWLIESLMHGDQNLRSAAGIELQKVTQVYYGYVASAPKRDRERAQRRYQDWWDGEGRMKLL